ncbi:MAG: hypothetical protein HY238_11950 [Acidobacteria bacterium]|nr:hypothetical protein [Acidobacteriota bacterium]
MRCRSKLALLLLVAAGALAQEVDHRIGTYRVIDSFEYGYRSVFVSGNREAYRSALNYNNGFRLLDGTLRIHSGDGHGRFVDELVLTTFGAGGDPYQASSLRLEKNRFYRLDMGFRVVNYYDHLLALSGGEHRFNTERIFQNYDLTLFPTRRFQLLVGYDRNNQNGPALTSEEFDVRREAAYPREQFFVFADNVRRLNNQWRAGANATLAGIKFSFLQGLDYYKEDPQNSLGPVLRDGTIGLAPQALRRSDPVHGRTPFTRFNVHTDANRRLAVNGRFVYAGGDRRFALDENISALSPVGGVVTRQAYILGLGRRNQGTGDLTLSIQPGERWTLSNTTSINQTRITGDSAFVELRTPLSAADPGRDEYYFDYLGIRLISNATDVNFRPGKRIGFYGGYHYSIQRIRSRDILQDVSGAPTDVPIFSVENRLHSGLAGVRLRPLPPLTMLFDIEYGHADHPFTPIGEKRYHAETAKAQWKWKAWLVTGSFKAYRNRNNAPPVLDAIDGGGSFSHHYQSRQYSAGLAWTPAKRYGLDAGYGKLHLNTASGIVNFPLAAAVTARRSLYESELHHAHGTFRVDVHNHVALFLGYSIVKDTAGGRGLPLAPGFALTYPNFGFDGTDLINAYPLSYQAPQARLTVKLHKKLSWNANWQYYGYHERFSGLENYHAHMSSTSLRWGF